jgi:hypothetical protein
MLNISSCGKCGGHSFKVALQEPSGCRYKVNFVQCASCNTPIGVLDYYNTGAQLEEQKKLTKDLANKVAHLEHDLHLVLQALQRRG